MRRLSDWSLGPDFGFNLLPPAIAFQALASKATLTQPAALILTARRGGAYDSGELGFASLNDSTELARPRLRNEGVAIGHGGVAVALGLAG